MNIVCMTGRLTKDPEKRMAGETPVTSFTVAVDRPYTKGKTDFFSCVAWRSQADFVEKYFHKGDFIALSGYMTIREWEDKNHNKRTTPEVVVDQAGFGGGGTKKENNTEDFPIVPDEDELPF